MRRSLLPVVFVMLSMASPAHADGGGWLDITYGSSGHGYANVGAYARSAGSISTSSGTVVAGTVYDAGTQRNIVAIARLTTTGTLDETFGADGTTTLPIGTLDADARSVAQAPDGTFLVSGTATDLAGGPPYQQAFVARFAADGTPTDLGGTGFVLVPSLTAARAVLTQADGKILVGGWMYDTADGSWRWAVARLAADGSPDTTFDTDGVVYTAWTGEQRVEALALAPGGDILAVGYRTHTTTKRDFAIARYNANGTIDTAWGSSGRVAVNVPANSAGTNLNYDDVARAVAVTDDGKVVVAGAQTAGEIDEQMDDACAAVRLLPNGALDTTFSGNGRYVSPAGNACGARGVAVQPDGKVVMAGAAWQPDPAIFQPIMHRLRYNGTADTGWGSSGYFYTYGGSDTGYESIAVNGDRLIPGGWGSGQLIDGRIAVGSLDTTAPTAAMDGLPTYSPSTTLALDWTGSDANGIAWYELRYKRAHYTSPSFGSYTTLPRTTVSAKKFAASVGYTYCFSVRAIDGAGLTSPWTTDRCTSIALDDRNLAVGGGSWSRGSHSSYYQDTLTSSSTSGSSLLRTGVDVRRFAVMATKCASCGIITVWFTPTGGSASKVATFDLTASSTQYSRVLAVPSFSSVRSGTVTVKQAQGGYKTPIDGLWISLR